MATHETPPARSTPSRVTVDDELEQRLVRYARIDTQSDEASTTCPSTKRQYDLLRLLERELSSIGAHDVQLTDYGVVLATIPATTAVLSPTIAFLAHVDTAPAVPCDRRRAHRAPPLRRRRDRPARRPGR